jgi:hypothetical protein
LVESGYDRLDKTHVMPASIGNTTKDWNVQNYINREQNGPVEGKNSPFDTRPVETRIFDLKKEEFYKGSRYSYECIRERTSLETRFATFGMACAYIVRSLALNSSFWSCSASKTASTPSGGQCLLVSKSTTRVDN